MNRGFSGTFSFKLFPPRVQNRYTGTGCYSFNKTSTAVHGRRKKQRTRNLWKCLSGGSSSDQAGAGAVCRHEGHRSHRQKAAAGD